MRSRATGWGVLVALLLGQIYALYLYVPGPGPGDPYSDKVAHLLLFGVPAIVATVLRSRAALVALLVHALVSEPLQGLLTATRSPDGLDLVADLLGIVVGMGIGHAVTSRWERAPRDARPSARGGGGVR